MKKKRTYILLIVALLISFICTACMWTEEGFIEEAKKYMKNKYNDSFGSSFMYDRDAVMMSLNKNQKIYVLVEYGDFKDNGTKEWGDNYLYYLHMDEIYKDTKEVIDTVYENSKIYIHINRITNNFPVDTDIVELYKRGTFTIYVYTDKDIKDKDNDVLKIIQGMYDKSMYCTITLSYLRESDFTKMSEDKINEVSGNGIYNASTNLYIRSREQDSKWRYGDFKKDLE